MSSETELKVSYKTCFEVSERCPVVLTTYGYRPDMAGNCFFVGFFGLLCLLALGFGIKSKSWMFTLALCGGTALEALGYVGRIMMHNNPWDSNGFKMQICCLVLAPSLLAACIYLTLKHLVLFFGPEHSILRPRLYPWVFIGCDIGSIVLQAIGGGVAAAATNQIKLLDIGNALIITGIAFQVATMSVCGLFCLLYYMRYQKAKKRGSTTSSPTEKSGYHSMSANSKDRQKLVIFCSAFSIAYVAILIRCIYRLPEMAGGWGNPLMRNEKEFLILDGGMIATGALMFTAIHPTFFFPPMTKTSQF